MCIVLYTTQYKIIFRDDFCINYCKTCAMLKLIAIIVTDIVLITISGYMWRIRIVNNLENINCTTCITVQVTWLKSININSNYLNLRLIGNKS